MKQTVKNIISIVLLVFYLAGFCGIHLLKHSCSSCNHSTIQLTQNDSPESDQNDCSCNHDHAHNCSDITTDCEHDSYCCDYQLIYLKNNPTTTITKQNKAPLANETILFICQSIKLLVLLSEAKDTEQTAFYLLPNSETDLNLLCTYRC
ncbi:hypothetical protein BZG02_15455 [Labilibaculum filiforme]|uniref:Uncharacterized protein n=1 Tax=Labilibaculum filiforme TaxID=1940526 RepID=A0A2N3HU42_9BACT|nr:hypothetical protein BZG02_15455 [Labilibaculum filiforme]